jgi:hypothetical protein
LDGRVPIGREGTDCSLSFRVMDEESTPSGRSLVVLSCMDG